MAQYGNPSYWDERYQRDTDFFDWYQRWAGLKDCLKDALHNKGDRILIVGCGRSRLSEDLFEDGFKNQINIDISSIAISQMKQAYKDKPSMEFRTMNAMDMNEFSRAHFDVVMDKGTLDSILCGEKSTTQALAMLKEISRVLK